MEKFVKENVKLAAFTELKNENPTKEKTKEIHFDDLKLSEYLEDNEKTTLSQQFSVHDQKPWT